MTERSRIAYEDSRKRREEASRFREGGMGFKRCWSMLRDLLEVPPLRGRRGDIPLLRAVIISDGSELSVDLGWLSGGSHRLPFAVSAAASTAKPAGPVDERAVIEAALHGVPNLPREVSAKLREGFTSSCGGPR